MDRMVTKIEAAVDVRDDPDLLILGRTDAIGPAGVDEAITRLNAYADAGADVTVADALRTKADIERVCEEVDAPVRVNMGYGVRERRTTPLMTPNELERLGVSMVTYGRLTTGAAARGIQRAYGRILDQQERDELLTDPELTLGQEEYTDMMGLPELRRREQRYAIRRDPGESHSAREE